MPPLRDMSGERVGRLLVISRAPDWIPPNKKPRVMWLCQCDCGTETTMRGDSLRDDRIVSCGCYQPEMMRERHTTHGGTYTREYGSWKSAKARCFNPNDKKYADYGGRGITMCEAWRSDFAAFLEHIGPCPTGLTLGRIHNDKNYEPGNVRWETYVQQNNNQRGSRRIDIDGQLMTLTEAAAATGIPRPTLASPRGRWREKARTL